MPPHSIPGNRPVSHGAGKGDKDRSDSKLFKSNYELINFSGVDGFTQVGPRRYRKTYTRLSSVSTEIHCCTPAGSCCAGHGGYYSA